jgi:hypothetical protein
MAFKEARIETGLRFSEEEYEAMMKRTGSRSAPHAVTARRDRLQHEGMRNSCMFHCNLINCER